MRVVMVSKALVVGAYQRKAEEIARLGIDLTVLVPESWKDRRGEQQVETSYTDGYQLTPIPIRFNGQFHLHYYPTLRREMGRLRPDILHMDEEPYNLATWQGLRIADDLGAASLFFTWQNLTRHYPPPFSWIEKKNYSRATMAIAGNHAASSVLSNKGFEKSVEVVPQFGVDPEIFKPLDADGERAKEGMPLRIGYAGGLLPEKGIDDLIRACAGLTADWHLSIVGEGSQRSELETLAVSLGVADSVTIYERKASSQMPAFYQTLDLFVLPSRTQANWMEQFGRVLIEAMACNVAVVGSNSGEIPTVLGDAGLIYPEGDVAALSTTIQQLANEPALRNRLAHAGRTRVLQNYTMAQVAQKTVEVYRGIAARQ